MKKILITGGAGFIGSTLIKHLQEFSYELFVYDNLSFGSRSFIEIDDNHFIEADILDKDKFHNALKTIEPEWVIHLAAIHFIPYCNQHPFDAANINIKGTINILDAIKETPSVKKVFFASTAAVYPISDDALNENNAVNPMDIYGLSKFTCEHICNEFYMETLIPVIICRFFNAFGPNETNPHLIPEIQNQINAGKRSINLGNLSPKRDFIHTHDMARAVRMLMEEINEGIDIFNLGRGIEYSVTEIVAAFERQLNEVIEIKVETARVRKVERMHLLADISKIKSKINWKPEWSIDDGIKTLIDENMLSSGKNKIEVGSWEVKR